jgi:hypothetical protein
MYYKEIMMDISWGFDPIDSPLGVWDTITKMKTKFGNMDSLQGNGREIVGYYKHNGPAPIIHKEKFFEMECYSETTEVGKGIYPIYEGWESIAKGGGSGILYVEFTGVVTKETTPTSLEGVQYTAPEKTHINNNKSFAHNLDVLDAIHKTGNPPNKTEEKDGEIEPDIYVNPKYWDDILCYYTERLIYDIAYLQKVLSNKQKPLLKNLTELSVAASCLLQKTRIVEEISNAVEKQRSKAFKEYLKINTNWIPKTESTSGIVVLEKQNL